MYRISILVIACLLAGLFALSGGQVSAATTIYVDDDNCPGPGTGTALDPYCAIQDAVDAAGNGDTASVAAGTYAETVTIKAGFSADGVTISGDAANRPVITGGVKFVNTGDIDGITFENLYIKGDAGGMVFDMDNAGAVNDFTMNRCVIDGQDVSGRHGFGGQNLGQSFTMTYNEFKDILGWAVMDIESGSGDGGSHLAFTTVTFSGNNVHDVNGSVALRGKDGSKTTMMTVLDNTWENVGGNNAETGEHWAAVEVNHAVEAVVQDNKINDVQLGVYGEGECMQFWDVDTLDVSGNRCTNNAQGIFIYGGGSWAVPGGSVSFNQIAGNSEYGLKVDPGASGGPLNAECNWWGAADGPSDQGPGSGDGVSANVDYAPWQPQSPACGPVGGITDLLVGGSDAPASAAEGSGSSLPLYAIIAVAAVALALAAGGWYARRRWAR